MESLKFVIVVGWICSIADAVNEKTTKKVTRTIVSDMAHRSLEEQARKGRFDYCLEDPHSKESEIMETFEVYDRQGVHKTKCGKKKSIAALESNAERNWKRSKEIKRDIQKRSFKIGTGRWPNGVVCYKILSNSYSATEKAVIKSAMKDISDKTCITFQEYQGFPPYQSSCVVIGSYALLGCASVIGRKSRRQILTLKSPDCIFKDTVIHEILHALGMEHEQNRFDRNDNVEIKWENILFSKKTNFRRANTETKNPYDISSIMHYTLTDFAKTEGLQTIVPKHAQLGFLAGSATEMTFYDIKDIIDEYNCAAHCTVKPVCKNGGFVNHKCKCHCPATFVGDTCEQFSGGCGGYYSAIYGAVRISTPNYPQNYPAGTRCTYVITASSEKRIELTIQNMDLPFSSTSMNCYHWLEVRAHLPGQTGKRLCGQVNSTTIKTTPHGVKNRIWVFFDASMLSASPGKGLQMLATPIDA